MPVILVLLGVGFWLLIASPDLKVLSAYPESDVRNVMWKFRQTDILGQIVIILAGVFGVVVLFKERMKND